MRRQLRSKEDLFADSDDTSKKYTRCLYWAQHSTSTYLLHCLVFYKLALRQNGQHCLRSHGCMTHTPAGITKRYKLWISLSLSHSMAITPRAFANAQRIFTRCSIRQKRAAPPTATLAAA